MAQEYSARLTTTVNSADLPNEPPFQPSAVIYDSGNGNLTRGIQVVGTTEEALALGDVAAAAFVELQNLDDANYVEIGRMIAATFEPFGKISAGKIAHLEIAAGVTWYVRANTNPVRLNRFIPST